MHDIREKLDMLMHSESWVQCQSRMMSVALFLDCAEQAAL